MRRRIQVHPWVVLFFFTAAVLLTADAPKGKYMGQAPPGMEAKVFAPGFISTGLGERDAAFTPDLKEFYYTLTLSSVLAIAVTRQDGTGQWPPPEVASFSGIYQDFEPFISAGGKRFLFCSTRPLPGQDKPDGASNIWVMERKGGKSGKGWSEPRPIGPPINGKGGVYYPSLTLDHTLYFSRREAPRKEAVYRSRLKDGTYMEPERLPESVNIPQPHFNPCIAPDESFIVVPVAGMKDSLGRGDYYVFFRNADDTWSKPINPGKGVNSPGMEMCPAFSPDGKYFFFNRTVGISPLPAGKRWTYGGLVDTAASWGNGNSNIYWVDIEVIKKLRK